MKARSSIVKTLPLLLVAALALAPTLVASGAPIAMARRPVDPTVMPGSTSLTSAPAAPGIEGRTYDGEKVTPASYDGDVRNLPQLPSKPKIQLNLQGPQSTKKPAPGQVTQESVNVPLAPMPSPIQNFAGLNFNDSCTGGQCGSGWPPDPNGDVGRNHYIQAVNTAFAIYSKTGTLLAAFTEDSLWSASGSNPCNGNSQGDPVALYDQMADRWILTNFAFAFSGGNPVAPFYECIAVSKTNDPVSGGWWLYPLRMDPGGTGLPPAGTLNDYPKFGIWSDCLYMAANEFTMPAEIFAGTAFASFSRTDMYSGATLTWSLGFINNTTDPFTMIPSNLSGAAAGALPPGTPNYFVSESQTLYAFEVRKFTAGANCGGGGTLSSATNVSQASYTVPGQNIVPQPGTTTTLDSLGDRLMQKVQYRKVGSAESLWVVHTFRSSSTGPTGSQWAQIDVTGGTIATTPVQQQKYDPAEGIYRWMGSIAADQAGNVALGYSTSNGTAPNYPSLAYSGRLVADPLNQLPQSETQLIAGAGSQTNNCGGAPCHRWGDYSAMSVDPVDDCTFWYTNQYYSSQANGNSGNWQTRIGSFKFPSCTSGKSDTTTTLTSSLNPSTFGQPVTFTARVTSTQSLTPTGAVTFTLDTTNIVRTLDASGTATYVTSTLSVGTHAITTTYGGDSNFNLSTGTLPGGQTVNKASTTTSLISFPNPSAVGQSVTFTATVTSSGGTPTGSVTFYDGGLSLGSGTLSGNVATYSTSALAIGTHPITATYSGDSNFNPSTSPVVNQIVNAPSSPVCFAQINAGTTFSTTDASAVQQAVDAATLNDTVKVAGTCAGVQARAGVTQTIHISKTLTVRGGYTTTNWTTSDPSANPTTLDANQAGRVVYLNGGSGVSVTLENLTVRGGSISGHGGGIYNNDAQLTLSNDIVRDNAAPSYYGGGVYLNTSGATLNVNGSQVLSNTALVGGGVYIMDGSATVSGTQILGNTTTASGGGLYNLNGTLAVVNSTVSGNISSRGGGIENGKVLTLTNSTLSGNQATDPTYGGGAIEQFYGSASATILNCTLISNTAATAGRSGIWLENGTLNIQNSIVALNNGTNNLQVESGATFTSQGYNLTNSGAGTPFTATTDLTNTNPLIGPLQDNGGNTWTHALLPGSPAIDAGDPTFTPPPYYDQRGVGFPRVVNGRIDIGAYEAWVRVYLPVVLRN